jgi:hypothetical protein
MNKVRKEELYDVVSILDEATDRLEDIKNDELNSFCSMPDSFQNSYRGDKMMGAAILIDVFIDVIENIKSGIEGIANK